MFECERNNVCLGYWCEKYRLNSFSCSFSQIEYQIDAKYSPYGSVFFSCKNFKCKFFLN